MSDPTGAFRALNTGATVVAWWNARKLKQSPIAISLELVEETSERFVLNIHADNDFHHPLEIADCFMLHQRPVGDGGFSEEVKDEILVPTPLEPAEAGPLITVPAISRRSWRVEITREYLERTLVRDWAFAGGFETEEEAEQDAEWVNSFWNGRQMNLRAVVVLAHRARHMTSTLVHLPPRRPLEAFKKWWRDTMSPRLRKRWSESRALVFAGVDDRHRHSLVSGEAHIYPRAMGKVISFFAGLAAVIAAAGSGLTWLGEHVSGQAVALCGPAVGVSSVVPFGKALGGWLSV